MGSATLPLKTQHSQEEVEGVEVEESKELRGEEEEEEEKAGRGIKERKTL